MTRRGRIKISKSLIKMALDLPPHLSIEGIYELPDDRRDNAISIAVTGPFCPEVHDSQPSPLITPIYDQLNTGLRLLAVDGLDT